MNLNEVIRSYDRPQVEVALGLSTLRLLADGRLMPGAVEKVVVPDNLLRLVEYASAGSQEHLRFLDGLFQYFTWVPFGNRSNASLGEIRFHARNLHSTLQQLQQGERLKILTEDDVLPDLLEELEGIYKSPGSYISLSPPKSFAREYLLRIISWSRANGGPILEKSRRVFTDVGHHIATLQIPDKLDQMVDLKARYTQQLFNFHGGKATKWFVGLAVTGGGYTGSLGPASTFLGTVLCFADP